MIARLTGRMLDREPGGCVLDVNGVGYQVFATDRSLDAWSSGEEVVVHVSTQVREDAIALYGFQTTDERTAFRVLLTVSGVGPKMAMATLQAFSVSDLTTAIESDDVVSLNKINGVGKKKAQRLALELKGKMPASFTAAGTKLKPKKRGPTDQLPLALARLDYGKSEIDRALQALAAQGLGPDAKIEHRLAAALKVLSGRR